MSVIGGAIIGVYLIVLIYGIVQVNLQFNHGKIPVEEFERLVSQKENKLIEIVMIIVLFFFRGQSSKNELNNKTSIE
jgi:uncharacterized membrane protein YhaH (DUF805 family)